MTWLNHAGTSWPKPAAVHEAVAQATTTPPDALEALQEERRAAVGRLLGLPSEGSWIETSGCTSALATALWHQPWKPGDRLLIGALEHEALRSPCVRLAQTAGVQLEACADLDAFEAALRQGGVRLVATAHATNTTGQLVDLTALVSLAHSHGARVLVDAAQTAGWLQPARSGADFVAFAGHKGPQSPWGIGGLIAARAGDLPTYCDVGSVNKTALAGLEAGLQWWARRDRTSALATARHLLEALVQGALAAGFVLHGPREPAARMPVAALTHPRWSVGELGQRLSEAGVRVSAGRQCAPAAHRALGTIDGVVRFSAGPATTEDDIQSALDVLTSG